MKINHLFNYTAITTYRAGTRILTATCDLPQCTVKNFLKKPLTTISLEAAVQHSIFTRQKKVFFNMESDRLNPI